MDGGAARLDGLAPPLGGSAVPPRRPRKRLFRSAGGRFAIVFALLLAASAVLISLFLWWATAGLLNRETDAAIRADARGLSERWHDGGLPSLAQTVEERIAGNVDDDAIYLVVDPVLRRIAGNLARWPGGVDAPETWFELRIDRAGQKSLARVQYFDLPNGYRVLIGRDVQIRTRLGRMIYDALIWAVGISGALATLGAILVRTMFRRMIARVGATAVAISAGDLSRRVPLTGNSDEMDQLAETINDMLDRMARLMDGVRQVSNAIAHDLRTPIARARARLEEATRPADADAPALRAAIDRATADLDHIVSIFQALLRIAEIETGARRSAFTTFDLVPVLRGLAELYEAVAEERGLSLGFTLPARVTLRGDPALMQQAIANLLENAIKFSPPGAAVAVGVRIADGGVHIAVADHGPGIPPADRARATDRFFRGEAARSTPGSGLGLALVQAVVHLHGGTLDFADNAPGLRATVSVPALPPRPAEARPAEMRPAGTRSAPVVA